MDHAIPPLPDRRLPRPVGLLVLAILNFILGAVAAVLSLVIVATILLKVLPNRGTVPADVLVLLGMSSLFGVILIVAGIGYLRRSRAGRLVGNLYGILGIAVPVYWEVVGDFNLIGMMLWLVYPVITLTLLNGRFRKVFF